MALGPRPRPKAQDVEQSPALDVLQEMWKPIFWQQAGEQLPHFQVPNEGRHKEKGESSAPMLILDHFS